MPGREGRRKLNPLQHLGELCSFAPGEDCGSFLCVLWQGIHFPPQWPFCWETRMYTHQQKYEGAQGCGAIRGAWDMEHEREAAPRLLLPLLCVRVHVYLWVRSHSRTIPRPCSRHRLKPHTSAQAALPAHTVAQQVPAELNVGAKKCFH